MEGATRMELKVGKFGLIVGNPRNASIGWYIKIQPEAGGFLILYCKDPSSDSSTVYDDYVVDEDELSKRLHGWHIDWKE